MEEEVPWAMKQLPNKKGQDIKRIPVELLKSMPVRIITALCEEI